MDNESSEDLLTWLKVFSEETSCLLHDDLRNIPKPIKMIEEDPLFVRPISGLADLRQPEVSRKQDRKQAIILRALPGELQISVRPPPALLQPESCVGQAMKTSPRKRAKTKQKRSQEKQTQSRNQTTQQEQQPPPAMMIMIESDQCRQDQQQQGAPTRSIGAHQCNHCNVSSDQVVDMIVVHFNEQCPYHQTMCELTANTASP